MPGAGKSTVGVQLAKYLGQDFIDTDILIQTQQEKQLQEILDSEGHLALRQIEEETLLGIQSKNSLISTGGSAVYSEKAMHHLKSLGIIVYLEVSLDVLKQRVTDEDSIGIARSKGQTFDDIYQERTPLYRQYADIIYNNNQNIDIAQLITTIEHFATGKER